ncbi:transcriptional regulator [Rathayibacter tritici]|uniref:XRE family transcriptional regulator n=1 Tax=Rathayibacter tritici TaxID=33888 RepID=A0A160KVG4_9MICO|nr:helix-turn-helix domain-containing protein [Rathayibacter tritici]AND17946.1 XRE family transcriptional regulator [Rathayibacter tritici]PPF22180.1 transcriptional regulator [Rathayibacter tritici]PPF69834.1 transcriptional regulator [Rathayibacter tritici]PPG09133.1 transcriptional regulator [Rathayibacter tritici]PPI18162.1 transcriptional regulator [Rathayibacter tritici]
MASSSAPDEGNGNHRILCHLDAVLADRRVTLTELSARTGITVANLSILKNNRAKAIRFTTLTLICDALETTPQALFSIGSR